MEVIKVSELSKVECRREYEIRGNGRGLSRKNGGVKVENLKKCSLELLENFVVMGGFLIRKERGVKK